jgi:hypothetical protein
MKKGYIVTGNKHIPFERYYAGCCRNPFSLGLKRFLIPPMRRDSRRCQNSPLGLKQLASLFFCSEAPGLVFFAIYQQGIPARLA